MQVESDVGQTVYTQREQETGQTAYARLETVTGQIASTSGRQQTGSDMQVESRDPRSYPIQTAYLQTGSNAQIEPTDAQVHPGQTAHLPTGSNMQLESMDHRSRPTQTACTPPNAVAQQKTDNGRQEQRLRSPPDAATYPTVQHNARPVSGRAASQTEKDKITVEEERSSLQPIPEADLQSPAVVQWQQECRVVTQAVIEPEPRRISSATETSDKEPTVANQPEVAEPHQLTAPERTELEELRKLSLHLSSGFYPMPYFEPATPLTPGITAGPEVQMYARPADAYGTQHNGPSFYSPPGYTQCVYPNGVQYTPLMEAQRFGRPDKVLYAYPPGVTRLSPEAEMRQVDNVLPDRQSSDLPRQREMAEKVATTRPAVQFCEAIPEDMVIQPDARYQQDATALVQVRTPET